MAASSTPKPAGGAATPAPVTPPAAPPAAAKVIVRLRPLTPADGARAVTSTPASLSLAAVPPAVPAADFEFPDGVLDGEAAGQEEVWAALEEGVACVARGTCALVAAYGQTGSGKTHTIFGSPSAPGVAPRAAAALAAAAPPGAALTLTAVEIYCDKVRCLLGGARDVAVGTGADGRVVLTGARAEPARDGAALAAAMRRAAAARATGATAANAASSRSHAVLIVAVSGVATWRSPSTLALVDLAGSERAGRTGAAGAAAAGEGRAINASLAVLGRVVSALAAGRPHVPFRDAALTRVLRDGLAGGARPTVIVCASPGAADAGETLGALRFGARARGLDAAVHATVAATVPSGGGNGGGETPADAAAAAAALAALAAARGDAEALRARLAARRAWGRVACVAALAGVHVAAVCVLWSVT